MKTRRHHPDIRRRLEGKIMIIHVVCILALSGATLGGDIGGCPAPVIENGGFTTDFDAYLPRAVIKYYCDDGYELSPARVKSSTCRKKGYNYVWRPDVPECVPSYVPPGCPVPPQPEDGSYEPVKEQYVAGDKITYTCDYGFYLAGSGVRECTTYGNWNVPAPKCEKRTCPPRMAPDNGGVKPVKDAYNVGDEITFYCDYGYQLEGAPDDYCTVTGEWQYNLLVTCVKICPMPEDYVFGYGSYVPVKPYYVVGDVITFSCSDGYCLRGPSESTCTYNGWDPSTFPKCLQQCTAPTVPNGGILEKKLVFCPGEYVRYFCDKGYSNNGAIMGRCGLNGQWIGMAVCKPVKKKKCPKPVIDNGGVDPDQDWYHPRATVDFYCAYGCTLVGKATATCKGNGKWNVPIPTCDCKPPPPRLCSIIGCGAYDTGAHCQCDWQCLYKRNCCEDFEEVCMGYHVGLPFDE